MKDRAWTKIRAVHALRQGDIGVLKTDTLYGVVARAEDATAVGRVYRVRMRDSRKPCIVLIGEIRDLSRFGVRVDKQMDAFLRMIWPGPVSVILLVPKNRFRHVHRGTGTIAFRLPKPRALRVFLQKTGPLIAPSANPEGKRPAKTIREARAYFKDTVDFYLTGGVSRGNPSKILRYSKGHIAVVRR